MSPTQERPITFQKMWAALIYKINMTQVKSNKNAAKSQQRHKENFNIFVLEAIVCNESNLNKLENCSRQIA